MVTLVVDDDEMARAVLEHYVSITDGLTIASSCASGVEAAEVLARQRVDLLLLDVEMPRLSGLELLASLEHRPAVILVTGSVSYAVDAFDYAVADYLVKPVAYPRFLKAVQRVRTARAATPPLAPPPEPFVFLKTGRHRLKVALADIDRVEARSDYVLVCTGSRNIMVHATMSATERFLPPAEFIRIHRSHIVRIDRIIDIEPGSLVVGGTVLPIGAAYRAALEARIRHL
jgi:two-component system, LytTR family, response regulator